MQTRVGQVCFGLDTFGAANAMVLLAISLLILLANFGLVDRLSRRLST
jgi:hypothetical protein